MNNTGIATAIGSSYGGALHINNYINVTMDSVTFKDNKVLLSNS